MPAYKDRRPVQFNHKFTKEQWKQILIDLSEIAVTYEQLQDLANIFIKKYKFQYPQEFNKDRMINYCKSLWETKMGIDGDDEN